ncbi:serine hydrolase domain-containing protein [Actinomadura oligospora]|uniref:serine hydrolase domain-containing protein n=1 Tax=Actinomadura oligospora TaxID=111804 RepID=UPI0004BAFF74|nr:serine hydrolase domain-containing protein [Actinomadura oligospora]
MTTSPRRPRRTLLAVAALAAGTLATGCASGANAVGASARNDQTPLQRDADAITALGVPGVQARVLTADGRNLTATSGVADLNTRQPVSPDGYFRIASVTKAFTATVILQLVGEGKLHLSDPVDRWLPGVVSGNGNDGKAIKIRHLLQHTSGIHDDYPDYTSAKDFEEHRNDTHTAAELVAKAMTHHPDLKRPGKGWMYSNTGYALLGMIIERVTGHPWHEEVRTRIVQPLGLQHTFWPGSSPKLPEPHAKSYQQFKPDEPLVDVTEQVSLANNGEAGLVSTTADLDRFFQALLGGRLVPQAQMAQMKHTVRIAKQFEPLMPRARDGLGIFSHPLPCGGTYWGHEGGDSGWITATGVTPDGRRSVTVSLTGVQAKSEESVLKISQAENKLVENALCQPTA